MASFHILTWCLDGKYGAQASAFAEAIANVVKNGQGST